MIKGGMTLFIAASLFLGSGAFSQEASRSVESVSQVVSAIKIQGQRKIESDAIEAKLISQIGQVYSAHQVRRDVEEIFKMGFFYNVIVEKEKTPEGLVLTYTVVERPSIIEIEYIGNSEIKDLELSDTSGLKAYEIFDHSRVRQAIEKIEALYEEKGFFLARIHWETEELSEGDQLRLKIHIEENDKVVVQQIQFLGNNNISSSKLKSAMVTKEGNFFSFLFGSGAYKQEAFDRDVQMLNFLYFNEGYVQVRVDRPEVYVTPDKKGIYITIRVEEGDQFHVGSVDFSGDLLFTRDELFESTQIQNSDLFVYQTLQNDLQALQAKYGDLGYAFANIIPRTRIREQDKEVDITFEIDKGNKVYIGQINVVGNTKTRDKVVRRELRVREGELYNETRRRQSMANVRRLGFFEEVNFNTKTPPGTDDIMDIDIVVKERNTGTIQVGAGYSSFQGAIFNGQVNQTNFLGRGQRLGASVNYSKSQSEFMFSFLEPYMFDTEWSGGIDLYQRRRVLFEYSEKKLGGSLSAGHPLAPYLRGIVRYKLDDTHLQLRGDGDPDLFPVETANGLTSSMTLTLEYDKRDDRFTPSDGIFSSLSVEYAGLGGDKDYTKGHGTFRYYHNVIWDIVWRNNITYGVITSNDPRKPVPFNELFLLGGANSLRGFDWFSVGKRRYSEKAYNLAQSAGFGGEEAFIRAMRPFGGTQQLYYNLEFEYPLIREAGIKGVVFYDVGQADDVLVLSEFRSNVGFGFRWFSPIGPLRFEWGFPLDRRPEYGEGPVNFQFAIGSPF